jgi:hypothetical protein
VSIVDNKYIDEEMQNAQDLENSFDLQNEIESLSQLMPQQKELSPQEKILEAYKNIPKVQKDYGDNLQNLTLLQGANQVAQGFARGYGADIGSGEAGINALKEQAKQPLKDIENTMDLTKNLYSTQESGLKYDENIKMADPKSDISKFVREQAYHVLKKINPDKEYDLENMSASQIKTLPGLKDLMGQKSKGVHFDRFQGTDGKVYMGAFDNTTGQVVPGTEKLAGYAIGYQKDPVTGALIPTSRSDVNSFGTINNPQKQVETTKVNPETKKEEKKQIELSDIQAVAPKKAEDLIGIRKDFLKDVGELRDAATAATNLSSKLTPIKEAKDIDSGLLGGIQTQAAKLAGQKGVLTDQDLVKFAGAGGLDNAFKRFLNLQAGSMSKADVQFFKDFSGLMVKAANKDLKNRSQIFRDRIKTEIAIPEKGLALNDSDADRLLLTESMLPMANKVKVRNTKTGQVGNIPKENLEKALKSGQYEEVK